jgi:hypothetical protein
VLSGAHRGSFAATAWRFNFFRGHRAHISNNSRRRSSWGLRCTVWFVPTRLRFGQEKLSLRLRSRPHGFLGRLLFIFGFIFPGAASGSGRGVLSSPYAASLLTSRIEDRRRCRWWNPPLSCNPVQTGNIHPHPGVV